MDALCQLFYILAAGAVLNFLSSLFFTPLNLKICTFIMSVLVCLLPCESPLIQN